MWLFVEEFSLSHYGGLSGGCDGSVVVGWFGIGWWWVG